MWCVGLLFGFREFCLFWVFYYYFSNLLKKVLSSSKWAEEVKTGLCELSLTA